MFYYYFDEFIHGDDISTAESFQYDFSTIRAATDNFSSDNKLGQGGFGPVYKGKLPNSQEVAVKRLSSDSGQGDLEFKNEVMLVARLQHRNLVRLLGFCFDGTERLLIYEYVPNASLDHFLFGLVRDIMRCIHIALLCVQENTGDRPTMAAVVLMLSSLSLSLPVPSGPAYYTHNDISPEISLIKEYNSRSSEPRELAKSKSISSSRNEASITELYPR
ncbi:hypothetical protein H5410_008030 [Solanum commersonii]|uniref:Protein kinase domain-containing protein n=1 Tax=Solanum commersonii TaxID=4109 RepID=A0A9J6AEV8_SOLCO|nr:hypothetical protein H5410_008030 [Solanum commersonii]